MARHQPREKPEAAVSLRLGPLEDALGFHIRMAQAASFREFQHSSGMKRMKPGWFAVLSLINDNPGTTAVALSRAAGRDKSTMTPLLRELESDGLIARLDVPGDRRCHALQLTEAGRTALGRLAQVARKHDAALDALAGADKEAVMRFLRRVTAAFE
jgi:DNA-binding MarR family transcriptional regulator